VAKIQDVRTPRDVLATTVRDLGIATNCKQIFERFPDLESASEGLAWLLTDRLILPGQTSAQATTVPILHLCLKHAIEWLNYELARDMPDLRSAQTAYMAGLLFLIPEVVHVEVRAEEEIWTLDHKMALSEWLPLHPGVEMSTLENAPDGTPSDDQLRLQVLRRILPIPVARLVVHHPSVLNPPDTLLPPRSFYGK